MNIKKLISKLKWPKTFLYLFTAIISFLLGAFMMAYYYQGWMNTNKENTRALIANFQKTYEIQREITKSYVAGYDKLVYCSQTPDASCSVNEITDLFKASENIRGGFIQQLNELNNQTTQIMLNFPAPSK